MGSAYLPVKELLGATFPPQSHPFSSCPGNCEDMEDRERGQGYFLHLLPGVLLPSLDADLQPRPYWCWQHIVPTTAAHTARGLRGNTMWGFAGWFLSPGGASDRGTWGYFFYLH